MKILALASIPTPYRDDYWRALGRCPDVQLKVLYLAEGKSDRPWEPVVARGYPFEVLPGYNLSAFRGPSSSFYWNPGLAKRIHEEDPDVLLVSGYNHPTLFAAMRIASAGNLPWFLISETWFRSVQPRGLRGILKRRVMKWIAAHAAGFFPTGLKAREYLESFGVDPQRCCVVPNVPDLSGRPVHVAQNSTAPVLLFAGRLVPQKRAELVLRAFAKVREVIPGARLVVIGDGVERQSLEMLARELGQMGSVRFTGFLQPNELPSHFAAADLFVLPSSETWGVAAVEAAAAGIPVLLSDKVGAGYDLLRMGVAAKVAAFDREQDFVDAIKLLLAGEPGEVAEQARLQLIREWAPDALAARTVKFIAESIHDP